MSPVSRFSFRQFSPFCDVASKLAQFQTRNLLTSSACLILCTHADDAMKPLKCISQSQLPPPLPLPLPGNCKAFACLFSPGGGTLANLAPPGGRATPGQPPGHPRKIGRRFLNFNMYVYLISHNFKANSDSVYKLSRFGTGRI